MTVEQTVAEPSATAPRARRTPGPVVWYVLLTAGFLLQVAWRLHLSLPLTGPVAHGDEDGYLLGARVLAGGPAATLPAWSIMRPMGYPLLLAPIYRFVQEPRQVYVGVHILDAVLMAACFPLLYLLARRLFGCARGWSAAVAFVLATLPSLVFFSQFALTDALLPELMLGLLLALHAMVSGRHRLWAGVAAGALAAYAANTHVRGLVMLAVLVVVLLVGVWRRWMPWPAAVAGAVSAAVVYLAGRAVNGWLERQLFPTGAVTVDGRVTQRLTSPAGLYRIAADGAGQIWHLCASTYGLAGLGMAAAIVMLARREGPRATRIVLGTALVMNAGIAVATAAGIPDEGRVNNHVYGRYVAMFAGLWALVAVVALARATWRRAAVLVAVGSAIVVLTFGAVELYAGRRMRHEGYVNFDAPELSFLSGDFAHLHAYRMTAYAIVFMLVFAALLTGWRTARPWERSTTLVRRWWAFGALGALLVVNLVAMVSITDGISAAWGNEQYHPGPAQLVRDARVVPGSTIAEVSAMAWQVNQRHQREVYWTQLVPFDPRRGAPPGRPRYVVSTNSARGTATDWNGRRFGYVAVLSYRETRSLTWVVWRLR